MCVQRIAAAVFLLVSVAPEARAQTSVGGHFGFVIPFFTHFDDETTTVSEDFVIGFPTGISVKRTNGVTFDLEFVPVIQNDPLSVDLTVHPGVIYEFFEGWGAGVRMAFEVKEPAWGSTPLINRSFPLTDRTAVFGELVLPIRFRTNDRGTTSTSIGLAVHLGVGF